MIQDAVAKARRKPGNGAMNAKERQPRLQSWLVSTPQSLCDEIEVILGQRAFEEPTRELAQRFLEWNTKILSLGTHYEYDKKYAEVFLSSDVGGKPVITARTTMTRMEYG
ncbi:hypothetical protein DOTSEDRAFT_31482 [Dothistroma septosporum NZE10]|uniref:Uncharacterized protein n=1 Tax=Dothistroma septosporum (strain NZE10 / CBS 128990) TaxID=675120 RepID=N1PXK4_DOTSN|nr:hypothetical protein DOTSEDRAFT_31482 [Dothistroma septosporum NZE10]